MFIARLPFFIHLHLDLYILSLRYNYVPLASRLCWVQLRWFYHQRFQMTSVCIISLGTTAFTVLFHYLLKENLFHVLFCIWWWCIFIVYYCSYALSFVFIVLMIVQNTIYIIAKVISSLLFSRLLCSTWHVTTSCWWIKHDLFA